MSTLEGTTVLVVGGGSGIGRRIAADVVAAGGQVVLAGRDVAALAPVVAELGPRTRAVRVDLGDESSVWAAAQEIGTLDHVVSLAAAHANGPVAGLEREAVLRALDAKVVGPLLLAKHLAPRVRPGGSFLLFSGVAASRPAPGLAVMATTNGAAEHLARALAVELAPLRVNALSPGIVDSGAWDGMGEAKAGFLADTAAANPTRTVGTPADIAAAVLLALTNPFLTGTTLHVDGGGRLA